ncbi:MAG: transposase [Pyrinomonadaceae bacterium]|nr:transposase [Phycisphaerales bacterium]
MPERVLCDNGPPWGVAPELGRHTTLTMWMRRLGIHTSHGRPYHPQTQGKEERFHRTLKAELLSRLGLRDLDHAQQAFDVWRDVYNLERPSQAIGLKTPSTRYQPSHRAYPEKLPELQFCPDDAVRRVKTNGEVSYKDRFWYVGIAFAGQDVGKRETLDTVEVRYGPHMVASINQTDSYAKRRPA